MTRFIKHTSTLMFYDSPIVIEAQDDIGGKYIGLALDSDQTAFKYLIVGVQPSMLYQFRRGRVDLRNVLEQSEQYGWDICETDCIEDPITLEPQISSSIPNSLLPIENVFISVPEDGTNLAMSEATDRSNFVVRVKLDPESYEQSHKLKLKDYGKLILGLNELISSANESVNIPTQKFAESKSMVSLDIVAPANPGSLVVLLEASIKDDDMLDPYSFLKHALSKIDDSISCISNIDDILNLTSSDDTSFPSKFQKFMELIEQCNADLQYSWAEPKFQTGNVKNVNLVDAKRAVSSLDAKLSETISTNKRTIHGTFVNVTKSTGRWGLATEEGLIEGRAKDDSDYPTLDGLVVGKKYRFVCIERQTYDQLWKNTKPELVLHSIDDD